VIATPATPGDCFSTLLVTFVLVFGILGYGAQVVGAMVADLYGQKALGAILGVACAEPTWWVGRHLRRRPVGRSDRAL